MLPPFYETAWFIALICAFIILIIYSIYRYRISQFLKLQAIRNNIARDLHDDIGSTLGSINMYTEAAAGKLKKEQPEDAEEVLKKMGTASREMIERMSDIVWSINSRNDRFENLRHRMQAFAAGMLSQREIEFTFDVQEELNKTVFSMKLRKNIFLIFKEAIHNIAKYAQCKKASIVLSIKDNIFKMVIKDDGKGFDVQNNPAYNGDGIKNMRTRSEEIGARLNINSNINEGTSVELIAWL